MPCRLSNARESAKETRTISNQTHLRDSILRPSVRRAHRRVEMIVRVEVGTNSDRSRDGLEMRESVHWIRNEK